MSSEKETHQEKRKIPWNLILAGVVILLVFIFIVQNSEDVEVKFFLNSLTITMSSAFLIFISLGVGMLISYLIMLPRSFSKKYTIRQLEKDIQAHKQQIDRLRNELRTKAKDQGSKE
jgi:uncharacterized integral membrane protein